MSDYHSAFERGGIPDQAPIGLLRLCAPTAVAADPGYETLAPSAPSREELVRFFTEQRDRFERSEAARAFRDGLRPKGGRALPRRPIACNHPRTLKAGRIPLTTGTVSRPASRLARCSAIRPTVHSATGRNPGRFRLEQPPRFGDPAHHAKKQTPMSNPWSGDVWHETVYYSSRSLFNGYQLCGFDRPRR
jgi:hypothetical protein